MTNSMDNRNGGRRIYKSQRHRKYVQQDHYMNITPNRLNQQKNSKQYIIIKTLNEQKKVY